MALLANRARLSGLGPPAAGRRDATQPTDPSLTNPLYKAFRSRDAALYLLPISFAYEKRFVHFHFGKSVMFGMLLIM